MLSQVPPPADVPQLDPGDKDEALDKEKLLGQVEDLQKQLKEIEEELVSLQGSLLCCSHYSIVYCSQQNKTSSKLTQISQDRDSIERELKDVFSLQEETVKKLQDEVDHQKVNVYCVYLAVVYSVHMFCYMCT